MKANFMKRLLGAFVFDVNRNSNNNSSHPRYYFLITCFWWGLCFPLFILDIIGLFRGVDIVLNRVSKGRPLSAYEIKEIEKVFGLNAIPKTTRIVEAAWSAKLGAKYKGAKHLGFVLFNRIYFSRKINTENTLSDMAWLVHEVVHIKQYETVGVGYIIKALRAQRYGGYSYAQAWLNSDLKAFNFEQQGELAKHYYMALKNNQPVQEYQALIQAMRSSKF